MAKKILEFKIKNLVLIFGMLVAFALTIFKSYFLAKFIEDIAYGALSQDVLIPHLAAHLGVILVTIIANLILVQYLPLRLSLRKSMAFSKGIAKGILNLSQKNYDKHDDDYYINLITSSAFTCGDLYSQLNIQIIGYALCILLLLALAFTIHTTVAICLLLYIPLYALALKISNHRASTFQKQALTNQDTFLAETKKVVEAKRSINMARANTYFSKTYESKADQYLDFVTKSRWYSLLATHIPHILSTFFLIGMMGLSLTLYLQGQLSLTYTLLAFQLTQVLEGPLDGLFQILSYSSSNEVHVERMETFKQVIDEPSGFEEP